VTLLSWYSAQCRTARLSIQAGSIFERVCLPRTRVQDASRHVTDMVDLTTVSCHP